MISAFTISFLFGAALGQRFHVLVLLPATVVVVVISVGVGIVRPQAAWEITKSAAVAAIFLQLGYFAGLILRHFVSDAPQPTPVASAKTSTRQAAASK